jgi:hypothetical protein
MENMICQHYDTCEINSKKSYKDGCYHGKLHKITPFCSFECRRNIKNCIKIFDGTELNKIFDDIERI